MITIRDRIWLYCAVPDAYNTARYALPGVNTVKPWDACRSLDLKKAVMDVTLRGPEYPFDPISEKLSFLDELVWTVIPSGGVRRNENGFFDTEEVIRQIRRFPNVGGVFCDDFQLRRRKLCPPEKLAEMGRLMKAAADRPLDQWLVVYNYDLFADNTDYPIWNWTNNVDVLSFWTWQSFQLKVLPEHIDYVHRRCPDKKLNLGLYLWDFSLGKPLTDEWMQIQLDTTLDGLRRSTLSGITVCASCLMGLGIKAEDDFRRWLDRYGNEEIEDKAPVPVEAAVNNERV